MPSTPTVIEESDVIVIGAGFVGLAVGAGIFGSTQNENDDATVVRILEQGPECGSFWRGGHEDLSLHSPYHRLPHDGGLADEYPMFKTKHQVREYLQRYMELHGLTDRVSFGETVIRVEYRPQDDRSRPCWLIHTNKRDLLAHKVVVATGLNRKPYIPHIQGMEDATCIDFEHSWNVSNCDKYIGRRVLLVGSGNSSAELAVALYEAGAASVEMLVDGPRHFIRRSIMGHIFNLFPYFGVSIESMVFEMHRCTFGIDLDSAKDKAATDTWERFQAGQDDFIQLLSVDLSRFGIRKPLPWKAGAADTTIAHRIPVYDVDDRQGVKTKDGGCGHAFGAARLGVIDLIKSGDVKVRVGRIRRFASQGVVLEEGRSKHNTTSTNAAAAEEKVVNLQYDDVILATGFRHCMHEFLDDALLVPLPEQCSVSQTSGNKETIPGAPLIDSRCRSRVIDSIYLIGMDHLSVGPVLGYRGYDVGAAIAANRPPLRYPSLPADEQDGNKPLFTTWHALGAVGMGAAMGAACVLLNVIRKQRPPIRGLLGGKPRSTS